jgi:hypothetical protein
MAGFVVTLYGRFCLPPEAVVIEAAAFDGGLRPSRPVCAVLSRLLLDNRQPSRDGLPSPPRYAAGTNQTSQRDHLFLLRFFPRHYPCQQRLISSVAANVLGRFSMGGLEVIIYGRF